MFPGKTRTTFASACPLRSAVVVLFTVLTASPLVAQVTPPPAASQNPSPMVESTRRHERLSAIALKGTKRTISGPANKPVDVFVPTGLRARQPFDVVIHFHGAAFVAEQAVASHNNRTVAVTVNIGTGSGGYDRAFTDSTVFDSLLVTVAREVSDVVGQPVRVGRITLTAWSAGHGAIRAIIRNSRHFAAVHAILLIDGLHTSYIPEGRVLALGGTIDTTNLVALTQFARDAVRGEKRLLVTHSEIFPGTFVSTTETADWMLQALGLSRTAVLRWGPRGMQQLSEVAAGRFTLQGFAGNTAPDHVDQFHALPELLARLSRQ